ncbi:SAM-dependent methyltransferase, partial [Marinobacter sp. B9-2]
ENLYIPKAPKIAGYIYKGRATKPAAASPAA